MRYISILCFLLMSCSSEIKNLSDEEKVCLDFSIEAKSYLIDLPRQFDDVEMNEYVVLKNISDAKNRLDKYSNILFDCQFSMNNKELSVNRDYSELINDTDHRVNSARALLAVYGRELEKNEVAPDLESFVFQLKKMLELLG